MNYITQGGGSNMTMGEREIQAVKGPAQAHETARLAALRRYCVLDTGHEARFDDLARLAASVCATPVSLVSLVDSNRLFFKAAHGFDVRELPDPEGFCTHAIRQRGIFEIPDTLEHAFFARHPLVVSPPGVRFYAGAPLFTEDDFGLGTLCVIDFKPRTLSAEQRELLRLLAKQVMVQLDLGLQTMRDSLTGLYNRRPLEESLHREIARAMRRSDPIGVMAIDIDHFKHINDSLGHETGDAVLRAVGAELLGCVREDDVACRAGGEEFVVILPGIGKTGLLQRAEVLRRTIEHTPIPAGAETVRLTVSIGLSVFPDHGATEAELLRAADAALYQAKAAGRNRVVFRDIKTGTGLAL
jgi:diguanylate cyclase (GGDEF)-like protein